VVRPALVTRPSLLFLLLVSSVSFLHGKETRDTVPGFPRGTAHIEHAFGSELGSRISRPDSDTDLRDLRSPEFAAFVLRP
jgi:hypothetical protein